MDWGSNTRRVVVIGAGGSMTTSFLRAIAKDAPADLRFDLRDVRPEAAESARAVLGAERASVDTLDLFDAGRLAEAVSGAAFVVHGAGPFHRTATPVRRAAIMAGARYLDIDDDVESTLEARSLHDDAVAAGVPLFLGCGASPGITNVLARDLIDRLDSVEAVDVAWAVGDEGPVLLGRSVLGHTLHMGAGDYTGWRGGAHETRRSFAATRKFPLPDLARQTFYECAHPEPVMLGASYPGIADITCWGSIHPGPLNGLIKGIAEAEAAGRISYDGAIDFLQAAIANQPTDKRAEKLAMQGVSGQLKRGEISRYEYWNFIAHALLKRQYPTVAATAAMAVGKRNGASVTLLRYIDSSPPGSPLKIMEQSTGCAEAAFFLEACTPEAAALKGVLFPEQWITPNAFYQRFDQVIPPGAGKWLGPVLEQRDGGRDWAPADSVAAAA